jgi:UDP-N-acetylmuramoyl-tripeptide--D-alanyl-D-alanine ligase
MATPIPINHAEFSLKEVADACGGDVRDGMPDERITGIAVDSRAVVPGGLFVAIRGERLDGHDYVADAVSRGAICVLVERGKRVATSAAKIEVNDTLRALGNLAHAFRQRFKGTIIAITGSVGKTTTKELTVSGLAATHTNVLSTSGNLNNLVGLPMTLFTLTSDYDVAVLEFGSSAPGEIARLAEIAQPQIGVVTAVAVAHTLGLGSIEEVAREKASLLLALPASGTAIYNNDSEPLRQFIDKITAKQRISFGSHQGADVRIASRTIDKDLISCCRYEFVQLDRILDADLSLVGKGAAIDAAAALAVVLAAKGSQNLIAACTAFKQLKPVNGRLRPVKGPNHTLLLDDTYNSNPESTLIALNTAYELAKIREKRAIAILGDMAELGGLSRSEHEKVGREAVDLGFSTLIFCGEEMAFARDAAVRAFAELHPPRRVDIHYVADPRESISIARERIREEDVVLIKGSRCMAMERVLDGLAVLSGVVE